MPRRACIGSNQMCISQVTCSAHMPFWHVCLIYPICKGLSEVAGVPLKPMLAKICEGIPDALRQLGSIPFLAEYKYDGQRAQIHLLPGGEVKVFSRNCEDRSPSFPDVAEAVRHAAKGTLSP